MRSAGCVSKGEEKTLSLHMLFVLIPLHKLCEKSLLYPLVKKLPTGQLVQQLRTYLKRMGYTCGPLFRAEKNGRGGPLHYQSMQERWDHYCSQAGVVCTLPQLRHTHATELLNGGVSLPTIRKRLGHKHLQTTLRYAEQNDGTADAEVRAWRRKQS